MALDDTKREGEMGRERTMIINQYKGTMCPPVTGTPLTTT